MTSTARRSNNYNLYPTHGNLDGTNKLLRMTARAVLLRRLPHLALSPCSQRDCALTPAATTAPHALQDNPASTALMYTPGVRMHRKTSIHGAARAIWSLVRYASACVTRARARPSPPHEMLRRVMSQYTFRRFWQHNLASSRSLIDPCLLGCTVIRCRHSRDCVTPVPKPHAYTRKDVC